MRSQLLQVGVGQLFTGVQTTKDDITNGLATKVMGRIIHMPDGKVLFQRYGKDDTEHLGPCLVTERLSWAWVVTRSDHNQPLIPL